MARREVTPKHEIFAIFAHEIPIKTLEGCCIAFVEVDNFETFKKDTATEGAIPFLPDRRSFQRRPETT